MIPEFIRDNHPDFVTFVAKYFEFLEDADNPYDVISKILSSRDIDDSISQYYEEFRQQFAPDIPERIQADLKLVIKHIREFFQQKGNENSFAFLFRTIFDEPIEFYYPRVDILRASDGKWHKPTYITVVKQDGTYPTINEIASDWLFKEIIGLNSGDTGYVEGTILVTHPDDDPLNPVMSQVQALIVSENVGAFVEGETLRYLNDENSPQINIAISTTGVPVIDEQPGDWINTDGFLSSNKYLQDNYYYQEHSYQIRTAMSSDFYWRTIRKNTHPAGTIFFGVVDFLDGLLSTVGLTDRAAYEDILIHWVQSTQAGNQTAPVTDNFIYNWEIKAIAAAWTYAYIEYFRESPPFNSMFRADSFDSLYIGIFVDNATTSFPYSTPGEVTVV